MQMQVCRQRARPAGRERAVHRVTRRLLWVLAFLFALVLIWRRVRIVILVQIGFWQLALLFLALAAGIYIISEIMLGKSDGG